MQWGDALPALEKAAARGQKVPALEGQPRVSDHLRPILQLWTLLHGRRQVGFSANPISFADMSGGLDFFCVEGAEQREDWIELLIALDVEFLADQKKKTPRPGKGGGRTKPLKRR